MSVDIVTEIFNSLSFQGHFVYLVRQVLQSKILGILAI